MFESPPPTPLNACKWTFAFELVRTDCNNNSKALFFSEPITVFVKIDLLMGSINYTIYSKTDIVFV